MRLTVLSKIRRITILLIFLMIMIPACRQANKTGRISGASDSVSELYFNEAQKQAKKGEFLKAEAYFLRSSNENPKDVRPLLHLSYLYRITRDHKREFVVLQKIIKDFPGTEESSYAEQKIKDVLDALRNQLK